MQLIPPLLINQPGTTLRPRPACSTSHTRSRTLLHALTCREGHPWPEGCEQPNVLLRETKPPKEEVHKGEERRERCKVAEVPHLQMVGGRERGKCGFVGGQRDGQDLVQAPRETVLGSGGPQDGACLCVCHTHWHNVGVLSSARRVNAGRRAFSWPTFGTQPPPFMGYAS